MNGMTQFHVRRDFSLNINETPALVPKTAPRPQDLISYLLSDD